MTRLVIQENNNDLVDYDACVYLFRYGHRIQLAYIHGLYTTATQIEMGQHIVLFDFLDILTNQIKELKNARPLS